MKERLSGYKAPAWGFFVGLMIIGGLTGFLLGEVWLGRGYGRYVGSVFAVMGLVLAAMLWRTRPNYTDDEIAAAVAERKAREAAAKEASRVREQQSGSATVRVKKSARAGKRKG